MHGHRTLKKSHIFVSSSRPIFTYTYRLHLISLYPCIPYFPSIHFSIIIFLSFSSSLTFLQSLSFQSPFLSQSLLIIFLPFSLSPFSLSLSLLSFLPSLFLLSFLHFMSTLASHAKRCPYAYLELVWYFAAYTNYLARGEKSIKIVPRQTIQYTKS